MITRLGRARLPLKDHHTDVGMTWLHNVRLRHTLYILAAAAVLASAASASAQPQPVQNSTQPQQTTATYDDWIVRCATVQGPPARKNCEMAQNNSQANGNVISQVVIGRASKTEPTKMVVLLPLGIWLPSGVKLVADAKDPGLVATFKRCLPQACFAEVDIGNDALRHYRMTTEQGHLQFKDGNQKDTTLPVSFKGFGTALDALAKE